MALLLFMLPFMLAVGACVLGGFVWAVRSDQFEDLEGQKHRFAVEEDA